MERYVHNELEMANAGWAVDIFWPDAQDHQPKITEHRFSDAVQARMFFEMCKRDGQKAALRERVA